MTSVMASSSHEERRMSNSSHSTIKTYRRYSDTFDPLTAPQEELILYGIPRRPDPKLAPQSHEIWSTMFRTRPRYVEPRFRESPHTRRRTLPPKDRRKTIWAGSAFSGAPSGVFSGVSALWVVPATTSPDDAHGVLAWVGIDGWGTDSVLQIGTEQSFANGNLSTTGWWDWFHSGDDGRPLITEVAANPGDVIAASVSASSPTTAILMVGNVSANVYHSFSPPVPDGVQIQGHTVEWSVEQPGGSSPLANFGQLGFTLAAADYVDQFGGATKGEVLAQNGTLLSIVDENGLVRATSAIGSTGGGLPAIAVTFVHD
jgi:hypothetical protein